MRKLTKSQDNHCSHLRLIEVHRTLDEDSKVQMCTITYTKCISIRSKDCKRPKMNINSKPNITEVSSNLRIKKLKTNQEISKKES